MSFFLAGALEIVNDRLLYNEFSAVQPPEERQKTYAEDREPI